MPSYFIQHDNDWDDVIFDDDRIKYDNITFDDDINEDDYEDELDFELEDLIERPPDIYSDDHPWDRRRFKVYRFNPEIWMLNVELPDDFN